MVTQINLKFQDDFYDLTKEYANSRGYMSIQELVRDALREKIYDDLDLREEYKQVLNSDDANSFSSVEHSKNYIESLRKKAKNERV